MKKTYKALLCGAAAVAAVGIAYAMDERFFEKAKDKLTVFKCRATAKSWSRRSRLRTPCSPARRW